MKRILALSALVALLVFSLAPSLFAAYNEPLQSQQVDNLCSTNGNVLGRSGGLWGCTSISGANYSFASGYVNLLRNASLTSWFHGGIGSALTITTAGGWCAEGIWVIPTGASVTCQETTTGPTGNPTYYALKITGNTSVTDITVRFVIESYSAAKIAGTNATFQLLWLNNSGASITPTIQTKFPGAQDSWGAPTIDLAATNLQACTNGSSCTEGYTLAASASANNGYEVNIDFGNNFTTNGKSLTIGGGFDFRTAAGAGVGLNNSPPAPEIRDAASDTAWNQRFYVGTFANGVAPAQGAGVVGALMVFLQGASAPAIFWQYPTQMRASPTIVTYNTTAANANWRDLGVGDKTVSVDPQSGKGANGVLIASTVAGSQSDVCAIHVTADATITGG